MTDNFNLRKFLIENRLTENSRREIEPTSILGSGADIIASGDSLELEDMINGLTTAYEAGYDYFDLDVHPEKMDVSTKSLHSEDDIPEVAQKAIEALKNGTCADETVGWYIVRYGRTGIYPKLTPKGVEKYKELQLGLKKDIDNFYKGTNYWGD